MDKGIFITVEGIDGSGKTTQALKIKEFFELKGRTVIFTKEPGGTKLGKKIREILLNDEMNPVSEFLLFASDRKEHVDNLIVPELKKGHVVISDRFHDSSVAYQGFGRGVSLDFINFVHSNILGNIVPDLTLIFDVLPEVGLHRLSSRDRIERAGIDFLRRVRRGYLEMAKTSNRFAVVDANRNIEAVWETVKNEIIKRRLVA
jgi:dTMP kinase